MNINEIINSARIKYPISVFYKGYISEEEMEELEKYCDVHCGSVYMDGSGCYSIRHKEVKNE